MPFVKGQKPYPGAGRPKGWRKPTYVEMVMTLRQNEARKAAISLLDGQKTTNVTWDEYMEKRLIEPGVTLNKYFLKEIPFQVLMFIPVEASLEVRVSAEISKIMDAPIPKPPTKQQTPTTIRPISEND